MAEASTSAAPVVVNWCSFFFCTGSQLLSKNKKKIIKNNSFYIVFVKDLRTSCFPRDAAAEMDGGRVVGEDEREGTASLGLGRFNSLNQ